MSGCSQVSFNPKGDVLVVTEKQADVVSTYLVNQDGVASAPIANQTSGNGPFGFTFTQTGKLLETENFGGAPGQGSAASYEIGRDGTLTPISGSVFNMRSDTCWIVLTDDGKYAYSTNAMSNDISSYRVDPDGSMTLLQSIAGPADDLPAPPAVSADLSLSANSKFLLRAQRPRRRHLRLRRAAGRYARADPDAQQRTADRRHRRRGGLGRTTRSRRRVCHPAARSR